MKKYINRILFIITVSLVSGCNAIWTSPPYYDLNVEPMPGENIISTREYLVNPKHARPYVYEIKSGTGGAYILGIDHTKDENSPQIQLIQKIWKEYQPNVALVEGRLGFLFSWIQNPINKYGESGEVIRLARESNVKSFTWEPEKAIEVKTMLRKYPAQQVALFYSIRPYFSNYRFGNTNNPDSQLLDYIRTRTDHDGIRDQISSVKQVDEIWQRDFPNLQDWRKTSDQYGWPPGYLADIANASNQIRDIHLCSIILEEVKKGNKVFVSMGSSHAFRIETALKLAARVSDNK